MRIRGPSLQRSRRDGGSSHLSLLHLWAPLVMVKPPVSSCWMCMARRRAEGRVGWARKRRPSIRHRLSLFRNTWWPSQRHGRGRQARGQSWAVIQSWLSAGHPGWRPQSRSLRTYKPSKHTLDYWIGDRKPSVFSLDTTKATLTPLRKLDPPTTEMQVPPLTHPPRGPTPQVRPRPAAGATSGVT